MTGVGEWGGNGGRGERGVVSLCLSEGRGVVGPGKHRPQIMLRHRHSGTPFMLRNTLAVKTSTHTETLAWKTSVGNNDGMHGRRLQWKSWRFPESAAQVLRSSGMESIRTTWHEILHHSSHLGWNDEICILA
jgi:hypothetical protein